MHHILSAAVLGRQAVAFDPTMIGTRATAMGLGRMVVPRPRTTIKMWMGAVVGSRRRTWPMMGPWRGGTTWITVRLGLSHSGKAHPHCQ